MVTPLRKKMLGSEGEALQRYYAAIKIMRRIQKSYKREAWQDGEILEDVLYDLRSFLSDESLEGEVFGQTSVPTITRATGRTIPDLRKIEHVCAFQNIIKLRENNDTA